ncbi:MAG TPA: hypothetical protein VN893_11115 [Bryobacteraceae bacterium]|nr:hypothetical protein [Bryobacteraceae bacterium]
MRLRAMMGLVSAMACLAQQPAAKPAIEIPAGTIVALAMTSPVWAKTVKLGDSVYAETAFPVTVNDQMAIPPRTYVRGQIDILTLPKKLSGHAELRVQLAQMVFADGSAVSLSDNALATINVVVSPRSDILLDNGTQFEMVLERPLTLDGEKVAAAVRMTKPVKATPSKSATRCRPIPATQGSEGTVMQGSPPTVIPGTPDIVIPGVGDAPSTTIPGTPPTVIPGSDATVIGATPGTAEVPCPAPPSVVRLPVAHKESFTLSGSVRVGGQGLARGTYDATWEGLGPTAEVRILRKGKAVATAQAQVTALGHAAPDTEYVPRTNADGSLSLDSIQFEGRTFGLRFDP